MKIPVHHAAALLAIARNLPPPKKKRRVRPQAFKQHDVTRALRAAKAAGLEIGSFEIDPASGKIVIRPGAPAPAVGNDLDQWLREQGHAH
jgi:hypothetical protein